MSTTVYNVDENVWSNVEPVHRLRESLGSFIHNRLKEFESDRVLEVNYDNQRRSTAGEVLKWSTNAAINFEKLGVKKGDVVVFFCQYNSQVVPLIYGCYMIGAVVNCFDVLLDEDKTINAFNILNPRVIIYSEDFEAKAGRCSTDDAILIPKMKIESQLFTENDEWENYQSKDLGDPQEALATLLMSSGSTGAPKMVTLSHALLFNGISSMYSNTNPGDKIFATAPIRWITQYSLLHKPVFNGAVRICTGLPTNSQRLCEIIRTEQISHLVANLNMAYDLFDHLDVQGNYKDLNSLSHILLGGDCVPDAMIDTIIRKLPKVLPIKCYGMSELGGLAATNEPTGNVYLNGGALFKGVSVKIIDFEGTLLSYNKKGRIFLNMGIKFLGYYNTEGDINDAFQDDWLETGDYGFMDKGNNLHLVGRCKDIINHKGIEIIPSSIQAVLNFHEAVKTSIVLGIGSERKPVIFVILNDKAKILENVENILMDYLCSSSLPKEVLEVLGHIEIMESIPMLTTGKYDKVGLERLYLEK
ncbi:hypothetical protein ACFFRR_001579 [Megaselia abdita]